MNYFSEVFESLAKRIGSYKWTFLIYLISSSAGTYMMHKGLNFWFISVVGVGWITSLVLLTLALKKESVLRRER